MAQMMDLPNEILYEIVWYTEYETRVFKLAKTNLLFHAIVTHVEQKCMDEFWSKKVPAMREHKYDMTWEDWDRIVTPNDLVRRTLNYE